VPKRPPKFVPTFIRGGYYTPDQLADFLLAACKIDPYKPPLEIEAKKALTRAIKRLKPPADRRDEYSYAIAYIYQKRSGLSAFEAIKQTGGKRWRTLWDKLQASGLTLKQRSKNNPLLHFPLSEKRRKKS
jgi:hypothetical protein